MAATSIEWCDHSINPIRAKLKSTNAVGHYCEKIAAGCKNCYASDLQRRFKMPSFGSGQKRDDVKIFLDKFKLLEVERRKKPTRYLWCDMTDLFGEFVPDELIDKCFDTMWNTPQHTHLLLTKRPERMLTYIREKSSRRSFGWTDIQRTPLKPGDVISMDDIRMRNQCGYVGDDDEHEYVCDHPNHQSKGCEGSCDSCDCPIAYRLSYRDEFVELGLEDCGYEFDEDGYCESSELMMLVSRPLHALPGNVWFGFSASDQTTFKANFEAFAPMREISPHITLFCSLEPLLGPIDFQEGSQDSALSSHDVNGGEMKVPYLNWVIVGGESGVNARPCDDTWIKGIIDQCGKAGVPVFNKQLGSNSTIKSRDRKGGDMNEWPRHLGVRQFPAVEK
jgi:protein gp37